MAKFLTEQGENLWNMMKNQPDDKTVRTARAYANYYAQDLETFKQRHPQGFLDDDSAIAEFFMSESRNEKYKQKASDEGFIEKLKAEGIINLNEEEESMPRTSFDAQVQKLIDSNDENLKTILEIKASEYEQFKKDHSDMDEAKAQAEFVKKVLIDDLHSQIRNPSSVDKDLGTGSFQAFQLAKRTAPKLQQEQENQQELTKLKAELEVRLQIEQENAKSSRKRQEELQKIYKEVPEDLLRESSALLGLSIYGLENEVSPTFTLPEGKRTELTEKLEKAQDNLYEKREAARKVFYMANTYETIADIYELLAQDTLAHMPFTDRGQLLRYRDVKSIYSYMTRGLQEMSSPEEIRKKVNEELADVNKEIEELEGSGVTTRIADDAEALKAAVEEYKAIVEEIKSEIKAEEQKQNTEKAHTEAENFVATDDELTAERNAESEALETNETVNSNNISSEENTEAVQSPQEPKPTLEEALNALFEEEQIVETPENDNSDKKVANKKGPAKRKTSKADTKTKSSKRSSENPPIPPKKSLGQVKNNVTIKRNGAERQAESIFTIAEELDGSNKVNEVLMSFGTNPNDSESSLANIISQETNGNRTLFLRLSQQVVASFPEEVQEAIAPFFGQDGLLTIEPNGAPISIDPASGDIKTTIKSKDSGKDYVVIIGAGGISCEYDGQKGVYAVKDNETVHTSMSQAMFEACFNETQSSIVQIKGLEINRTKRVDATKIPMFMLNAYIQSKDINNDGTFREAYQELPIGNALSIAILSQPTPSSTKNQYFLKTNAAIDPSSDEKEQNDEVRLIDGSSFNSTVLKSVHLLNETPTTGTEEEISTLVSPKLAFNMSGSKKARVIELPMDKKSQSVDAKIVSSISRLADFVGEERFPEPPTDVQRVSLNTEMDEQLYSTRKDELKAQKLANKNLHKGASLVTELDDPNYVYEDDTVKLLQQIEALQNRINGLEGAERENEQLQNELESLRKQLENVNPNDTDESLQRELDNARRRITELERLIADQDEGDKKPHKDEPINDEYLQKMIKEAEAKINLINLTKINITNAILRTKMLNINALILKNSEEELNTSLDEVQTTVNTQREALIDAQKLADEVTEIKNEYTSKTNSKSPELEALDLQATHTLQEAGEAFNQLLKAQEEAQEKTAQRREELLKARKNDNEIISELQKWQEELEGLQNTSENEALNIESATKTIDSIWADIGMTEDDETIDRFVAEIQSHVDKAQQDMNRVNTANERAQEIRVELNIADYEQNDNPKIRELADNINSLTLQIATSQERASSSFRNVKNHQEGAESAAQARKQQLAEEKEERDRFDEPEGFVSEFGDTGEGEIPGAEATEGEEVEETPLGDNRTTPVSDGDEETYEPPEEHSDSLPPEDEFDSPAEPSDEFDAPPPGDEDAPAEHEDVPPIEDGAPPATPSVHRRRSTPFVATALKEIERDKNFKLKPEWGQAAFALGIGILLLSVLLGPVGIIIGSVLGGALAAGGAVFAINAESMNSPYIKMEKFLIDPLLKQEREFENEQAQFWETEEELHKANEEFNAMESALEADDNTVMEPWRQFFSNEGIAIFEGSELQAFLAEDSLEARQAFISDLSAYHDLLKEIDTRRAAGATAAEITALEEQAEAMKREITVRQFGTESFGRTTEEVAEFGTRLDKLATSDGYDVAILAMRELNEVHERREALKEEMADQLLEGSDRLLEKVLASNALPNDEKVEFVRENANVIARRLCYQTETDIGLEELLSTLPSEALQIIDKAAFDLNSSRTEFESEIEQKHERDKDSKTLSALVSTLEDVMQNENNRVPLTTDEQVSEHVEALYIAQAYQKVKDHQTAQTALADMTRDTSANHAIADQLADSLNDTTINAVKQKYTDRDSALKDAGFYTEIGRELVAGDGANLGSISNTSLREQMELRLREAYVQQRKADGEDEPTARAEVARMNMATLTATPPTDGKAKKLWEAYGHDLDAEATIARELRFETIANAINTDPVGTPYIPEPTDEEVTAAAKKHKALAAYPREEQHAIVKICKALKQKDAALRASTLGSDRARISTIMGDYTAEGRAYINERENQISLEEQALSMILSGEFKLMLQDRCIEESYNEYMQEYRHTHDGQTITMSSAKTSLAHVVENRQKTIDEIVKPNSTNAKVQEMLRQVMTDATSYEEIRTGIENALNADASRDVRVLTTNENVPLATIINPTGAEINDDAIKAAKTRIAEHDATSQSVLDDSRKKISHSLGHDETQEIYTEIKKTLNKNRELEELSGMTVAERDKTSEKIDSMKTHLKTESRYATKIAKDFTSAMREPLDDGGAHRIAKIQAVLDRMQTQINNGRGRGASSGAKTIRQLALKYKFEMPQVTEEGFSWKTYMDQVSKHIEDTAQAEFDRVYEAKNASKTSEKKGKKKTAKRKKLKSNTLRLQRAIGVAKTNAGARETAAHDAAERAADASSSSESEGEAE